MGIGRFSSPGQWSMYPMINSLKVIYRFLGIHRDVIWGIRFKKKDIWGYVGYAITTYLALALGAHEYQYGHPQ